MDPAPDLASRLHLLEESGARTLAHSHRTLLDHLSGVHDLVVAWRARPALADAALFHAVYGTEFYRPTLLGADDRERVRERIGAEAERIVHLWSRIRRASLAANAEREDGFTAQVRDGDEEIELSRRDLEDLVTLWVAETLEQVDRLGGRTRHQPELYRLRALAPRPARQALERLFAERPFAQDV